MDEEELHSLMVAVDSGALSNKQIMAIHRNIQRKGRCFNCGRPGHFAKNCKSPKKAPGQFRKGFSPAAGKTCHNCKEVGNCARDCPKTGGGARTQGQDRGGGGGGGARPFGRPQGGQERQGGRPPTWKPRGGQVHNTEVNERPTWPFMMEELPMTTTGTTTTATTATTCFSPIASYIGHTATADPPPRTGLAACSHIPSNGGSQGETVHCRLSPTPAATRISTHGKTVMPVPSSQRRRGAASHPSAWARTAQTGTGRNMAQPQMDEEGFQSVRNRRPPIEPSGKTNGLRDQVNSINGIRNHGTTQPGQPGEDRWTSKPI